MRWDPEVGSLWENAPGRPTAVGAEPRVAVPIPTWRGWPRPSSIWAPATEAGRDRPGRPAAPGRQQPLVGGSLRPCGRGAPGLAHRPPHRGGAGRAAAELREHVQDPDLAVVRCPSGWAPWPTGRTGCWATT
ncbi:MAG: hypothetical protein R3F43_19000 [bacterium]